jgi:3-dehydroquinate synthase
VKAPANTKIDSLSYPVHIGYNLWEEIDKILQPFLKSGGVYVFIDHNTQRFCFPRLKDKIPNLTQQPLYSILPGEQSKDLQTLGAIWTWLMENGAGRNSLIINVGGGVVSDLGGFAAATFNRGMKYVNIPTSLIGQVDASIGGKSALNVSGIKNQVGLFYDPAAVFIIPTFLDTLPEDQYASGFAEIIKCAALSGGKFCEMVKLTGVSDRENIFQLIYEAVRYKSRAVAEDPLEIPQEMLNFDIPSACQSFNNSGGNEMILHAVIVAGMICEASFE